MNGERSIVIEGNAEHTILISGDGNQVLLPHPPGIAFRVLDEDFRKAQAGRVPADFYNGTRPNWANIALDYDARRRLSDELLDFVTSRSLPPQRIGVVVGRSGEGKTTLLMRAAWELSRAGFVVLWQHHGYVTTPYHRAFQGERRLVICLDDLVWVENLPSLVSDLNESGLPFVLLGAARQNEWENSGLGSQLGRLAGLRRFELHGLALAEVRDLLGRLEAHRALGVLEGLPAAQREAHFLERAGGQLLPALLTARRGQSFENIVESVFLNLQRRYDQERCKLILRGYAGIALVHRFDFWLSGRLLARFTGLPEAEIAPRLIQPLQGELLELHQTEDRRRYTRYPWVAEHALTWLAGRHLPTEDDLYYAFFQALARLLAEQPGLPERKLLTLLPLAFKRQGEVERARELFGRAAEADPKQAPVWQAWAVLEKEQGEVERARELFGRAAEADPKKAVTWQAWAVLEKEQGEVERARELLQRGLGRVSARRGRALLLSTLGSLLASERRYAEAESYFQQALSLDEANPLTRYHFAVQVLLPLGRREEACAHLQRALALGPRKARDQRRIEQALRKHCSSQSSSHP